LVSYLVVATFEARDWRSIRSDSQAEKPGASVSPRKVRSTTSCTPATVLATAPTELLRMRTGVTQGASWRYRGH